MLLQWLTFAVMILIQAVAAAIVISAMRTTLATYGEEIKALREWRHKFGPKEMVIDQHELDLKDHEGRIREIERQRHISNCEVEECPLRTPPHKS